MSEPIKLKNNVRLLKAEAPGGLYNSTQLAKLAEICQKHAAVTKVTEDQRISVFAKADIAEEVIKDLGLVGIVCSDYAQGLAQPLSCIGAHCEFHEQDALATAMELSAKLADMKTKVCTRIGVNGCARSCVPAHTLDISLIGEANGYRVAIGGKNTHLPEFAQFIAEAVPAEEISAKVQQLLEVYQSKAGEGQSLSEYIETEGMNSFVEVMAPYSQDAAGNDDPFAAAPAVESLVSEEMVAAGPSASDQSISIDPNPASAGALDDDVLIEDSMGADMTTAEIKIEKDQPGNKLQADDVLAVVQANSEAAAKEMTEEEKNKKALEQFSVELDVSMDALEEGPSAAAPAPSPAETVAQNVDAMSAATALETAIELETPLDIPAVETPAPAAATAPEPIAVAVEAEPEVDESAIEDKIVADMKESSAVASVTVDENESDRAAALNAITQGPVEASADMPLLLDDPSIVQDSSTSDDVADLNFAPEEFVETESTDDSHGFMNLGGPLDMSPATPAAMPSSLGFNGIVMRKGKTYLSFSNGMLIGFDVAKLIARGGKREFSMDNQTIAIEAADNEIVISIDGIETILPMARRAA